VTRKLTDLLKADVDAAFPDNTEGLITPLALRDIVKDVIDSLRPAYAALLADHTGAPLSVPLTASWTAMAGATFWNGGAGVSDPLELSADVDGGTITPVFIGWNHWLQGAISFTGASNVEYQFALATGGTPGTPMSVDGAGSNRIVTIGAQTVRIPQTGNSFTLLARAPGGNSTIEIHQARFIVELGTTRYI
jgi:hypothetical protein